MRELGCIILYISQKLIFQAGYNCTYLAYSRTAKMSDAYEEKVTHPGALNSVAR